MKELKLYQCEYCGTQYNEKEKARKCEKYHHFAMSIDNSKYHANADYPDKVEIAFDDGKKIWYKR